MGITQETQWRRLRDAPPNRRAEANGHSFGVTLNEPSFAIAISAFRKPAL